MSHISSVFRVLMPAPLTTHKFIITWPSLLGERVMLVAESTTFPSVKMGDVAIPFKGEVIYRPTGHKNTDHIWRVRVPEDLLMTVRESILQIQARVDRQGHYFSNRKTVTVMIPNQQDIPLPAFKLYGCWLVGRDPVNLDSADPTNPWKWNLEFRYADIDDMSTLQQNSLVK